MKSSGDSRRERNKHCSDWKYAEWLTSTAVAIVVTTLILVLSWSQQARQPNAEGQRSGSTDSQAARSNKDDAGANSATAGSSANLPLRTLTDIPLTGGPTRLDYQSLESDSGRLYIAHLGSDLMTAFGVKKQTIVGDVKDLKRVHRTLDV